MGITSTELLKRDTIGELVTAYAEIDKDVCLGLEYLSRALNAGRGKLGDVSFRLLGRGLTDYDLTQNAFDRTCDEVRLRAKESFWKNIVDRSEIRHILTESRAGELSRMLEDPEKLPEITQEAVFSFLQMLVHKTPKLMEEFLEEAWSILQPNLGWRNGYATNTKAEGVGEKAILEGYMHRYHFESTPSIQCDPHTGRWALDAVYIAFCLLDGEGVPKDQRHLWTLTRTAVDEGKSVLETDYFTMKWYKNCNIHMTFTRPDLVQELNRRMGGNRLGKEKIL